MDQKVKQHRFIKYLWLFHTPKKLMQSHLLRPGSGSGSGSSPRRPDPDPTGYESATLQNTRQTMLLTLCPLHSGKKTHTLESNLKYLYCTSAENVYKCFKKLILKY
jgi:hypothetical protein